MGIAVFLIASTVASSAGADVERRGEREATARGFTAHEHLDAHRLIHMGGRLYDPRLGRFLSVDPLIQHSARSQSLNPYSYVFNNPFLGTDPTGYGCVPLANDPGHMDCTVQEDGTQRTVRLETPTVTKDGASNGQQGQGPDPQRTGPSIETNLVEDVIAGVASGARAVGQFLKGFFSGGVDTAQGLYNVVATPS